MPLEFFPVWQDRKKLKIAEYNAVLSFSLDCHLLMEIIVFFGSNGFISSIIIIFEPEKLIFQYAVIVHIGKKTVIFTWIYDDNNVRCFYAEVICKCLKGQGAIHDRHCVLLIMRPDRLLCGLVEGLPIYGGRDVYAAGKRWCYR